MSVELSWADRTLRAFDRLSGDAAVVPLQQGLSGFLWKAGSVLTALRDFGVLEGKQKKTLVKPLLPLATAEAILRIMISEGYRGRQVLENHAWRLFLLTEAEVAQVLGRLAQAGTIRFEKVGTTVVLETPVAWEMPL